MDIIKGSLVFKILEYHLCFLILIFKNPKLSSAGLILHRIKGYSGTKFFIYLYYILGISIFT